MAYPISNSEAISNFPLNIGKLFVLISGTFLFIVSLTIFQDFLESQRSGYVFYFSESLLFKTIWFLYIPIVPVLYKRLKKESLNSFVKTATFIVLPIVAHLFIVPLIATTFSMLFYDGKYDLFKFFSYTMTHDLYQLIIVYASFVLGYKYLSSRTRNIAIPERKLTIATIVINNGKDNVIVNASDIIQITSATPYILIHLEKKRYLHSETLKSICEQLDSNLFVRIHKSTVINIAKVSSFQSRLNGDYDLQLTNGNVVRLSRTYAADFKKHFDQSSG